MISIFIFSSIGILLLLSYLQTESGLLSCESLILLYFNSYDPDKLRSPKLSILIVKLAAAPVMQSFKN